MDKKIKQKRMDLEEDLFGVYLEEMDDLVCRYPQDPNQSELSEEKLAKMMEDLDISWESFHSRWKHKMPEYKKTAAFGKVSKEADGLRHLVIKSDVNQEELLDLMVPDSKQMK